MHIVQHNEHMLHVPWPWSDFYTRMIICCEKNTYFLALCRKLLLYTSALRWFRFSLMKVPFIWDSHDVSRCFIRTPKNQAMRSLSLNKLPYLVHIEWYRSRYGNISETNFHSSILANNQIWANVKSAQCIIPLETHRNRVLGTRISTRFMVPVLDLTRIVIWIYQLS